MYKDIKCNNGLTIGLNRIHLRSNIGTRISPESSTSNPKELQSFTRDIADLSDVPESLRKNSRKKKQSLFDMWMRNQQCLKKCAAEWDRVRENEETAESKFMPFKKRELLIKYAKEKVEIIIAECKAENNYTVDPLFPADEEEHFWSVYVGKSYSSAEKKRDSAAVKTQADCDEKLRNALCGDGQILGTDTCLAGTSSM